MPDHDYEFLDCGDGQRLERFGAVRVVRPCPAASWLPGLPSSEWASAQLTYHRSDSRTGTWTGEAPAGWTVAFGPMRLRLQPSADGQIGVFPEQAENWRWITERITPGPRQRAQATDVNADSGSQALRVLNGFAYTGGSTLAAAAGGADVVHLDAMKSAVARARENAAASGLEGRPIRWIVDDVLRFIEREIRRGRQYEGLILDPPAFGRGAGGRRWKLEDDLPRLLELSARLLAPAPRFVLLSCHAPNWTADRLAQTLAPYLPGRPRLQRQDLVLAPRTGSGGPPLPCGIGVRATW